MVLPLRLAHAMEATASTCDIPNCLDFYTIWSNLMAEGKIWLGQILSSTISL
jgi:hypothetical protein